MNSLYCTSLTICERNELVGRLHVAQNGKVENSRSSRVSIVFKASRYPHLKINRLYIFKVNLDEEKVMFM